MKYSDQSENIDVILGNSNSRFSGVTSTMLQTLGVQKDLVGLRVLGKHHLSDSNLAISFFGVIKLCHLNPLGGGKKRIFHARRNDEMIQALILKKIFRCRIRIIFTSTAQRNHSRFSKWLMRQMDAIISTCDAAASYLREPVDAIIPHGVDTKVWHPALDRKSEWSAVGDKLGFGGNFGIGIFGRVRKQKGVHLFVRACIEVFKEYPNVTAVICGSISDSNSDFVNELKQEIDQNGMEKRIIFIGEQPFETIPELMRSVSMVAALSENEGFGLTPLEAFSSKTPVLATKAGAWPEIIEDEVNGFIVDVNDQKAITQRLSQMLSSQEQLEAMGRNGREKVLEKYTVEREAKDLCRFYKKIQDA